MRKVNIFSVVLLIVFAIFISGCSSGKSNPVSVQPDSSIDSPIPLPETNADNSNRNLLGTWTMQFNPETLTATVEPNREVNRHYSVRSSIEPPTIVVTYWDPVTETVHVSVTIENSSYISVFDVRLIIYTDDAGHILTNADDWTGLWDISEGLPINPFMAYAKTVTRRNFQAQASYTENLQIYCPNSNYDIQFAIDACFPGNCEEPYEISNFTQGVLYNNTGSSTDLEVTVLDWQDDVSKVLLHCPEITDEPLSSFEQITSQTWKLNLVNNAGASFGEYIGYLAARSPNAGSFELFDRVTITISNDNEPPVWDGNIGIEDTRAGGESVKVYWGAATDAISPPVEYLLYMDEDNDPWDQIPVIVATTESYIFSGLENGQTYWFGVRCRDSASPPNVDTNTFVLSAIPQAGIPLNPQIVGSYKKSIPYYTGVTFFEHYAYTAGADSLTILDIENPEEPEILGIIEVPGASGIVTNGEIACIGKRNSNPDFSVLTMLDVSDRSNPNIISSLEIPAGMYYLSLAGNTICVGGSIDGDYGYMLVDITDPSNPEIKSINELPDYTKILASGDYAYYTQNDEELVTVDISDPANPEVINTYNYDLNYSYSFFDLIPGYVLISYQECQYWAFTAIDVRDPLNPILTNSYGGVSSGTMHDCIQTLGANVSDNRVCFFYYDNGRNNFATFDISDPYNISGIGDAHMYLWPSFVAYEDYVIELSNSLSIYDFSDPNSPQYIRSFKGFYPQSIDVKGAYAYCGNENHDIIATFDISNPASPNIISEVKMGTDYLSSAHDVDIGGEYLYVANGTSGLYVLDIGNPGYPEIISTLDMNGDSLSIEVSGDYAYMVSADYGLEIVNISNPLTPSITGHYPDDDIQDADIQGNFAYITCYKNATTNGMLILDISDPTNPSLHGSLYTGSSIRANKITVDGNYAFFGEQFYGNLWIVDIGDPANPEMISSLQIYNRMQCCNIAGNYAYIGSYRLDSVDIIDPSNPEIIGELEYAGLIGGIHIDNNRAYLAGGYEGLVSVQLW